MEMTTCPHCGVRVAISSDGNCPSCRQSVVDAPNTPSQFADNPYESPAETSAAKTFTAGMTTGEKIYSAIVILCAGLTLVSLASFHFIIIPRSDDPGIFYFVVSLMWMYVAALAATTAANLRHRSLLTIPTIVQCVVLGFAVYFIPFSIWGGVLLYRRIQREKHPITIG
jgi:hypothetical protein